jgi:hypothetical protein
MAKAYERASKRVDAVSEALLAELIQRDVQQLTEDALGQLIGLPQWPRTLVLRSILLCTCLQCCTHVVCMLQRKASLHTSSAPCSASG